MVEDIKFFVGMFLFLFTLMALAFLVTNEVKGKQCLNKWVDRKSEYSFWTGCLVEYEGSMVPEDRVWFERNR